ALELDGSAPGVVAARERAGDLLLRSDPRLAGELARDRLVPLQALSPGSRTPPIQQPRVWLAGQGRPGRVAPRGGVRPPTARYRVGRLRELFGDDLDDPDSRFWLELALRVRTATGDTRR